MTWPRSVAHALMFLTAVAGPVSNACADAWTRDQGSWFGGLSVERWFSTERFDALGERVPYQETLPGFDDTDEYRNLAVRASGEYGFTREWNAAISTALEVIEADGNGREDKTTGLSDLRLQVKRLLWRRPVAVSTFVELKVPTGYDAEAFPALGNGEFETGLWLAVGMAWPTVYVSAEAGYVSRGGEYSDEVPFHGEAGWQFRRDIMLRTDWRAVMPTGDILDPELPFDPRVAHTRSLTGGLSLILSSPHVDLVFGFDQSLAGLNALAGTRYTFAVWWDR